MMQNNNNKSSFNIFSAGWTDRGRDTGYARTQSDSLSLSPAAGPESGTRISDSGNLRTFIRNIYLFPVQPKGITDHFVHGFFSSWSY